MTLISVFRYVSTFSMTIIAIDRYQALTNPLHRRLSTAVPIVIIIFFIWLIASAFSIPNVVFNQVVEISGHKTLFRCRALYPSPKRAYRQIITMFTFLTQYVLPLSITAFAYIRISINIWYKLSAESDQQKSREKSRRKTIKMLAIVVIVFSICWLPLNIFHVRSDFSDDTNINNTNLFFVCHWFAMSSVNVTNIYIFIFIHAKRLIASIF
jgi:G protein-coupled receptor 83